MSEPAKENRYTHLTEEIEGVNRTYTLDLEIEREGKEVVTRCSVEVKVRGKVYHTDLDAMDWHDEYHPDEDFKLFLNDEDDDEEGLTIPTRDQRAMTNWAYDNGY